MLCARGVAAVRLSIAPELKDILGSEDGIVGWTTTKVDPGWRTRHRLAAVTSNLVDDVSAISTVS